MALLAWLPLQSASEFGLYLALFAAFAFVARRLWIDHRIRKAGGTRGPLIASNPLTALVALCQLAWAQINNRLLEQFNRLIDRHGTETSPNCVELTLVGAQRFFLTREPEHIKTVLTTKFTDFGKGPGFHDLWAPFLGDSIFTTDGRAWHESRSLIRPMFVKDRVRDLALFKRGTDHLMSKLPPSGETVNIMDLFYRMTLDITTDFLLGHSINSLGNPKHEFARAFNEVQRIQVLLNIMAPVSKFIPKYKYRRGIRTIERIINPYIKQALSLPFEELEERSKSDKSFTFLHSIACYTRDPKVIRDQLVAVLLAGRDTTAATLSWTMYELSRYPAIYSRLRSEILSVVGPERDPSYEDLRSMGYLYHTLNETLRLYPAVPFNIRAALADTTLPGRPGHPEIRLLQGDAVVYSTLAMQRQRELYPPVSEAFADPALFSPDRWEKWTPKPWQYVPFNGGPRICVGQNFALTEMAFCLVRLIQKYERIEYRGNWGEQFLRADVVGTPGRGVPIALFEAAQGDMA